MGVMQGEGYIPEPPKDPACLKPQPRCTCSDAASAFSVNANPAPGSWREESSPRHLHGEEAEWSRLPSAAAEAGPP